MIPKDARVTILIMRGPTAFKDIPSMKADMYFGGRTPAKPARPLERMAIDMPKHTIIAIEITQAT